MSAGDPRGPAEADAPADGDPPDGSIGDSASASARRIIVARLASLVLIFVGSIILSRTLGPDGRGAHAFYVALTILAAGIIGLSAPSGGYILAARHDVPPPRLTVNALWFAALSGLLAAAVTIVLETVFGFLPTPWRASEAGRSSWRWAWLASPRTHIRSSWPSPAVDRSPGRS